ncbi:MAG: flavodoxin domain-containing protein [Burkholderiales bacterium]|nr:flavodoxin domain-containing protein [Burkholderiales bacterium]
MALLIASVFSLHFHTPDQRWLPATLVLLCYLSFCLHTVLRHRSQQSGRSGQLQASENGILVVYASQTGFAEKLARKTAQDLQQGGSTATVLAIGRMDGAVLQSAKRVLFIVSTTGEGDAPDSAAEFCQRWLGKPLSMPEMHYAILALGDRRYQHFCAFAHRLEHWLQQQQAQPLFDMTEVDNGDATALQRWQQHLRQLGAATAQSEWQAPAFQDWILAERHLMNPDSLGDPVYRIALTPPDPRIRWHAGDIAEIAPGFSPTNDLQMTAEVQPSLPHRAYSISSLPADGKLELLVRQMRQPDGSLGIGSGWLTASAPVGSHIQLRLRENRHFHTPPHDCPLILIGNGTGLAGLRAHLKQRALHGHVRNCLFFGERQRLRDFFHREEIQSWHNSGVLPALHLCFSRDQSERRYVQHALAEQASAVREWVREGAVIMVCGSMRGMAEQVHATLNTILGEQQVNKMLAEGSYRRDVY